eukprot:1175571-Prorocentrum_minimum.AAC.1
MWAFNRTTATENIPRGWQAMWALGVDTTRALSLIVSKRETTSRPWYREISVDDPVLAGYSLEVSLPPSKRGSTRTLSPC